MLPAGQNPRLCPGTGLHAPNPSPPISTADWADINQDIQDNLNEDSPLNAMEDVRHELARNAMDPNSGVVARVMNTEALQAQKAEAQENARRANARLAELQTDLDKVKQKLEEKQEEYLNYAVDSTLNECGNGIFITLEDFQVRTPTKQRGCNFQLTWNIFFFGRLFWD